MVKGEWKQSMHWFDAHFLFLYITLHVFLAWFFCQTFSVHFVSHYRPLSYYHRRIYLLSMDVFHCCCHVWLIWVLLLKRVTTCDATEITTLWQEWHVHVNCCCFVVAIIIIIISTFIITTTATTTMSVIVKLHCVYVFIAHCQKFTVILYCTMVTGRPIENLPWTECVCVCVYYAIYFIVYYAVYFTCMLSFALIVHNDVCRAS